MHNFSNLKMIEDLEKELKEIKLVEKNESEERRKMLIEESVKFTNEIRKKFGEIVKSVLVFGSVAKGEIKKTSDADLLVILDDTATKTSSDLTEIRENILTIASSFKDLHIQTIYLTEFWDWIRKGSPEIVNYLKYGLTIYDTGFIKPIQRMLSLGLIPPSEEAVRIKAMASEIRLKKIKEDLKSIIFDLRYCASDIIQATVMFLYRAQPDPKEIGSYLKKMVEEGKLEEEWVNKWEEINKLWKDVEHKIIEEIDGNYLQKALSLAIEIINRFRKFLPKELLEE